MPKTTKVKAGRVNDPLSFSVRSGDVPMGDLGRINPASTRRGMAPQQSMQQPMAAGGMMGMQGMQSPKSFPEWYVTESGLFRGGQNRMNPELATKMYQQYLTQHQVTGTMASSQSAAASRGFRDQLAMANYQRGIEQDAETRWFRENQVRNQLLGHQISMMGKRDPMVADLLSYLRLMKPSEVEKLTRVFMAQKQGVELEDEQDPLYDTLSQVVGQMILNRLPSTDSNVFNNPNLMEALGGSTGSAARSRQGATTPAPGRSLPSGSVYEASGIPKDIRQTTPYTPQSTATEQPTQGVNRDALAEELSSLYQKAAGSRDNLTPGERQRAAELEAILGIE